MGPQGLKQVKENGDRHRSSLKPTLVPLWERRNRPKSNRRVEWREAVCDSLARSAPEADVVLRWSSASLTGLTSDFGQMISSSGRIVAATNVVHDRVLSDTEKNVQLSQRDTKA